MAHFIYTPNRLIDCNGISDGANIYFFQVGTTTPVSIYSDAALTTPVSNPFPISAGVIVPALYYTEANVRVRVVDSSGATVSDDDPYERPITQVELASAAGAGLSGFSHAETYAASTVGAKLKAFVSITDAPYNAVEGDTGDQTSAIQAAVDALNALGGGTLIIPPGTYRIASGVNLYSNITVLNYGTIHLVATTRLSAFRTIGTPGAMLTNIHVRGGNFVGDVTFDAAGVESHLNGDACGFQYVSNSSVSNVRFSGFSDNAVAFADGSNNLILGCIGDSCGQTFSFYVQGASDTFGNKCMGCTVTNNGRFNALHSEGDFFATGNGGVNRGVVFANNVVDNSLGHGINIENSPGAVVTGNRVRGAGPGFEPHLIHGIFTFGAPNSAVTGNVSTDNDGFGIVIGAGGTGTSVSGNTTTGNTEGSCLITDGFDDGPGQTGISTTHNIAMGVNSFAEGDIAVAGNHSFLNRTRGFKFSNVAVPDATTLDWYEEGTFTPVAEGATTAGVGTYTFQTATFTRIGNMVHFQMFIGWSAHTGTGDLKITGLPYAGSNTLPQLVPIWANFAPIPAGQHFQAHMQQGASEILINSYTDTTGGVLPIAVPAAIGAFLLSGNYRL